VIALLDRAGVAGYPLDIAPHVEPVPPSLDALVGMLRSSAAEPDPAARVARRRARRERAGQLQLPNDYLALLTISDGMNAVGSRVLRTLDTR